MTNRFNFDLPKVARIIRCYREAGKQPLSAELIRDYAGQYLADVDTPVGRSWNAMFGRMLSKNRECLGIEKHSATAERTIDDQGRRTSSTRWVCLPG